MASMEQNRRFSLLSFPIREAIIRKQSRPSMNCLCPTLFFVASSLALTILLIIIAATEFPHAFWTHFAEITLMQKRT
ncbi:hypothetical protein Peur_004761 [Populus x canadensis]